MEIPGSKRAESWQIRPGSLKNLVLRVHQKQGEHLCIFRNILDSDYFSLGSALTSKSGSISNFSIKAAFPFQFASCSYHVHGKAYDMYQYSLYNAHNAMQV